MVRNGTLKKKPINPKNLSAKTCYCDEPIRGYNRAQITLLPTRNGRSWGSRLASYFSFYVRTSSAVLFSKWGPPRASRRRAAGAKVRITELIFIFTSSGILASAYFVHDKLRQAFASPSSFSMTPLSMGITSMHRPYADEAISSKSDCKIDSFSANFHRFCRRNSTSNWICWYPYLPMVLPRMVSQNAFHKIKRSVCQSTHAVPLASLWRLNRS